MESREDAKGEPFEDANISVAYVAVIDVLGFGRQIEDDFTTALDTYRKILHGVEILEGHDISLSIYSDTILVSSQNFLPLVKTVQTLYMVTLFANCLMRGGIGYGLHVDQESGANTFVVSQALNRAMEVEKQIKYPCVTLHSSVSVPDIFWLEEADTLLRPLLYFEKITLVNPFNAMWGVSARNRVEKMSEQYPEHREKYDWFLRLHDAVMRREALVPPEYGT
jgi:hypothetical protein